VIFKLWRTSTVATNSEACSKLCGRGDPEYSTRLGLRLFRADRSIRIGLAEPAECFLQTQQRAGIVALLAAGIAGLLALGSLDRLLRALSRFRVLARSSNCRGKAVVSS